MISVLARILKNMNKGKGHFSCVPGYDLALNDSEKIIHEI